MILIDVLFNNLSKVMSLTGFLARGINFDASCGVSGEVFVLPCKLLSEIPLITINDPLLIKRPKKRTLIK